LAPLIPKAPPGGEIVKRGDDMKGYRPAAPLGSRAHLFWCERNRRLPKDFENLAETLATFVTLASIQLALRRLARAWVVNSTDHLLAMQNGWLPATVSGFAANGEGSLSVRSRDLRRSVRQ
jgi:hypothetical protein